MAASQEQKVDFLLKKIGYVASKTGIAEDSSLSGTKKAPFGEAIPSPLVTPASSVWAEAAEIPETPPGSDTSFVRVYLSGTSGHRMTVDSTVSGNRTFIARSTYNDNTTAILGDWIDPSFGSNYIIKVFQGDPNSGGVQLSAAGSGSNDTWFFDYSSGVLNFNGTSVPSGVTSTNIYIVGYRYIGIKGVAVPGAGTTFTFATIGDLNITGVSTFFDTTDNTLGNENTGSVQLDGGMGIAKNLTVKQNLHVGGYAEFVGVATFKGGTINLGDADTDDINIGGEFISDLVPDVDDTFSLGTSSKQWKNLFINGHAELDNTVISGVSTFSSPLDINADVDIDGHTELDNVSISGVTTFQSNAFFGDADYIQMGDSQDLKIGHVGSYSVILDQGEGNLSIGGDGFVDIMNTALDEYKARFTTNGSVELYFDNVNKFETTGYGATVFGTLQSQQLNVTGVSTYAGDADFNGNVDIDGHTELDNVNISGVTTFQSHVHLGDTDELRFGDGSDLRITHNGTDSTITNLTGDLTITTVGLADDIQINSNDDITLSVANGEDGIKVIGDGAVELYYDSSKKFETTSTGIDVTGHTETDTLNVSGVSTLTGDIDANGNLDVDGTTELDVLNVSETATFSSNIDVDGHTELDNVNVSGVSTFVGVGTFSSDLFVAGDLNIIGNVVYTEASATNLVISGVSTFGGQIDANGDLDVDGHTNLDNVDIAGVTTTSGLLDINAGGQANTFKVEDLTDNRVVIAGTGGELEDDANLTFNGSTLSIGVDLDVDGHTNLDNVSVAGVTTFTGAIDANGNLDVDGTTELDVLNVAETATFSANIDANGDLDVDGHTELDNVNISGVATATAFHTGAEGSAIRVTSNTISGPAEMFIDPAGVGDNTGALRIKGDLFVDGTQTVINSTTIELGDFIVGIATTATTDSLADGAGIKIGPDNTFLYDHSNTSLKSSENLNLASSKTYKIDGTDVLSATTLGSGVVNSSLTSLGTLLGLTVSGQTTLNTLAVTGVSTFTGAIDANGDLDVDGHTNLDNVSVAGVTTFTGAIDANGNVDIAGTLDVDGISTLINDVKIGTGGTTTFFDISTGRIGIGSAIPISPIDINLNFRTRISQYGHLFLQNKSASEADYWAFSPRANGSITFGYGTPDSYDIVGNNFLTIADTGNVSIEYNLDVDGHTNLDNVSVAGVTTFAGVIEASAGENKIPSLYANLAALPSASTYHGMFAHVHSTGRAYFAHAGNWIELVNKNVAGNVGTGTEGYNVGIITATGIDLNGDLDVDGHTNLDNVSVAGVTTFASRIVGAATNNVIPFLYSDYGDLPSAGTYHGAFAHVHSMGKGLFAHGGAWYELVNKELNGTVGTGTERYNVGQIDATDVDVSGITTSVSLHVGVGGTVITASGIGSVGINSTTPAYALDVVGDINSSTDIKVNGVSIVSSSGASLDDVVALAIALG